MLPLLSYAIFFPVKGLSKIRSYTDNGDGTVTDDVTGLMWEEDMIISTWWAAVAGETEATTGGYTDWRLPSMHELFSLILYSGSCSGDYSIRLFIDPAFNQVLGATDIEGGREIDAQTWSGQDFDGETMGNSVDSAFGVNFVDGRVKTYPKISEKFYRYVRGTMDFGVNSFVDNTDGTVSDNATGLMWSKSDTGEGLDWQSALAYADSSSLGGYNDWRLPTIKELNSILDYNKTQGEAFIDTDYFDITQTVDPEGADWYPYFWSSTTLLEGEGDLALYQTFGRALGMENDTVYDAHGSGAIRGDPKSGNSSDYPTSSQGYQGDIQYVYNYVRIVRDIDAVDEPDLVFPIIETNTTVCYNSMWPITCPDMGFDFYGQDGSYAAEEYVVGPTESPTDAPTGSPTSMPTSMPTLSPTTADTTDPSKDILVPIFLGIALGAVGITCIAVLIKRHFCLSGAGSGKSQNEQGTEM